MHILSQPELVGVIYVIYCNGLVVIELGDVIIFMEERMNYINSFTQVAFC